ncbi:MAG: group II intron reverse transcriptase/maturase, partial [Bacteroidetes bacterium QH_1_61_8]
MDVEEKQRDIAKWSLDEDFRFDDIYNFITYEEWLKQAYLTVKSNAGWKTAGVDGETVPDFAEDLDSNIQALSQQLDSETYDPDPTRRVYIPKGDGEKRPLSIPTVRDRIVQEALRMLIEPIYESDFSTHSFGFRPGRSTHDAIDVVQRCFARSGAYKPWVIDADIKGFFDNVCHRTLEQILQDRITQEKVRDLIWRLLKAGVMESGRQMESMAGTPQGGILSPLLANVYLNELDHAVKSFTE